MTLASASLFLWTRLVVYYAIDTRNMDGKPKLFSCLMYTWRHIRCHHARCDHNGARPPRPLKVLAYCQALVVHTGKNRTSPSSLQTVHHWQGHGGGCSREDGHYDERVMKIPLFSTCAHIRTVVLCLLASTAVVHTSMDSSVCFYNVFAVFPRSTCMVETPTRFFRSYYCAHIHAQLRRNVRGRKCSFSSRYIVACFSFTGCCLK